VAEVTERPEVPQEDQVELTPSENRALQRRAARIERKGQPPMRKVRGGTPVTPIGEPEVLDDRRHSWPTIVGILAVALLFVVTSFTVGMSMRDGEGNVSVARVVVPRLDDTSLDGASKTLGDLGLLVAVDYQPNEATPAGTVFGQRPVAGSKLEVGTEVTLVVSDGPAGIKVPDVTGLQGAEAARLLQANGLVPTIVATHDEKVRPGEVLRTDPAAGNRAVTGAAVNVLVSDGPAPHVVPAIVDQPIAQGFAALGQAGVGLGAVSTVSAQSRVAGVIVSTDPPAGTSVPRDQPIAVVVTESLPSLTVPSVTGLLQATATKALSDSQLTVSVRSQTVPYDDARAGRVIAQSIPAGTAVNSGTKLQLTVAAAAAPPTTTTTTVVGATTTTTG